MLKVDEKTLQKMESQHNGIVKTILHFEEAELPSCPHCESNNTASVQVGIIGRTLYIATATTKVKLVPNANDETGKYFCNRCERYFN
jgi:hypothetical protein